jgi:hypothetical protein
MVLMYALEMGHSLEYEIRHKYFRFVKRALNTSWLLWDVFGLHDSSQSVQHAKTNPIT